MFTRSVSRCLFVISAALLLLAFGSTAFATDVTRYEQDDPSVVWTGPYNSYAAAGYSGGSYRYVTEANAASALATFTFDGTGVDWITVMYTNQAIGEVRIDGGAWEPVDLFHAAPQQYQQVVWSKTGLTNGTHVVEVRHTGTHGAAAVSPYAVGIDAFDVYTEPDLTITSAAGAGGSVSPAGATSVAYGASQAFTIAPNSGFAIADVKVDGSSIGAVASYTFPNVVANHTIEATFEAAPVVSTSAMSLWSIALLLVAGVAIAGIAARLRAG